MEKKLYLLRPIEFRKKGDDPWEPWYDKAFGFVVRAESEEEARKFADKNAGDENRGEFLDEAISKTKNPWLDPAYSTCEELLTGGEAGIVMQDFNAA